MATPRTPTRQPEPRNKPARCVARFELGPTERQQLREQLFHQVQQAWHFADVAGLRRSGWSWGENRLIILQQRIEALPDGELVMLANGGPAHDQHPGSNPKAKPAALFQTTRVQLHVPGYLLHLSSPVTGPKTS